MKQSRQRLSAEYFISSEYNELNWI